MKAATELLNDPEPAKVKLKLVRITLQNKVSSLKTLEEQIFTLLPEEKIEEDVIESDQVTARTRECIIQITSHLSKVNDEEATTAFSNAQSANSAKKVRLPKECWDKPRDMRSAANSFNVVNIFRGIKNSNYLQSSRGQFWDLDKLLQESKDEIQKHFNAP